jgi:hypothetical protein
MKRWRSILEAADSIVSLASLHGCNLDFLSSSTLYVFLQLQAFFLTTMPASSVPDPTPAPPLVSGPLPPNESRGPIMNIVGWVGVATCIIFMLLRLYSRKFVTRTLDWSDGIIVFAVLLYTTAAVFLSISISYGFGKHAVHIPLENVAPTLYYSAIAQPLGIGAYCLPKMSVVVLIISLMGTRKRGVWFLWTVIVILFVTSALACIFYFTQCDRPNHLWHPLESAGCYPDKVLDSIIYTAGCALSPYSVG